MYKIYFQFVFAFLLLFPFSLNAQNWMWTSEISPTSRMRNQYVLSEANSHFNLDWRNRFGKEIGNQLILGVQGNIRRYKNSESFIYSPSGSENYISGYDLSLSNTLWGVGPFITKKISLSEKFILLTTLFASMEQGTGGYNVTWESFSCPVCVNSSTVVKFPSYIGYEKFREHNLISGLEVGISYSLTSRLALLANFNILQFENFSRKVTGETAEEELEPHLKRNNYDKGSGFTHFLERPIVYLGIMLRW